MDCSSTTELHKLVSFYLQESVKKLNALMLRFPYPSSSFEQSATGSRGEYKKVVSHLGLHHVSLSLPPCSVSPYPSPQIFYPYLPSGFGHCALFPKKPRITEVETTEPMRMIQRTPQVLGVHFQSMKGISSDWKGMNNYQVGWRLGIDCIHIPNISLQRQWYTVHICIYI